jgi:hypothetical protein
MKKSLFIIAVLLLVAAVCGACGAKEEDALWSVAVTGADKDTFTSNDYDKLDEVSIDVVLKKSDGTETDETWTGVLLSDVLESLGVGQYSSVTLTASDGYAKDYTPDLVNDPLTIIGTSVNGEALSAEDGYIEAVAGSEGGNMWIKMLISITVNQ